MRESEGKAAKVYERPDGPLPRSDEFCAKCGAAPNVPHASDCPWQLWAASPQMEDSDAA